MSKKGFTKLVGVLLAMTVLLTSFAACGTKEKEPEAEATKTVQNTAAQTSAAPQSVTVKWVGATWAAGDKAKTVIDRFQKENPNIKVEYSELAPVLNDEFFQKYDTMIASGEQIDLVYMDLINIVKRAVNDAIKPVNDYVKAAGDDMAKEFGNTYKLFQIDDKIYGVPMNLVTYKIFYNKTWMAEKGITIKDDWTIDDYKAIAAQFNDPKAGVYGSFIDYTWPVTETMYMLAELNGWKMVVNDGGKIKANFDDPKMKKNLQFLSDISLTDKVNPNYATIKAEKLNRRVMFAQKKTPMYLDSWYGPVFFNNYAFDTEGGKQIDFEVGVANVPRLDAGTTADLGFEKPIGIFGLPKTSKQPQEAYQFAKYFVTKNPDFVLGIPASKSLKLDDVLVAYTNYTDKKGVKHEKLYPDQLIKDLLTVKTGHYDYYKHDPAMYAKYQNVLENLFAQNYSLLFTGQVTVDKFIEDMQKKGQEEIDKIK